MIKFDVTVFDAHLNSENNNIATKAATAALNQYPTWLLEAAYTDDCAGLEAGVPHFEKCGNSAWSQIQAEAEQAVVTALGFSPAGEKGIGKGAGWHLEIHFYNE